MTQGDVIKLIKGSQLPQFEIVDADYDEFAMEITFHLQRTESAPYVCSHCGQQTFFHYDTQPPRRVEDLHLGPYRMFWEFAPRRIRCPHCGTVHVETIAGISPHARLTNRFRQAIAEECAEQSCAKVARDNGLNESTVRGCDREFLAKRETITPRRFCERLGIDEIAIRKGHVYATVFYDHDTKTVLHMVQGRDKESVFAFFESMGKEWCEHVKVVTADLWAACRAAVRKFLPNARMATDKFHVCAYAADALDEVRRAEQAGALGMAEFDLKRGRFLLLKASARLDERGKARIEKLKELNANVYTAYLLKEQSVTLYEQPCHSDAKAFLDKWSSACIASGLEPFVRLGKRLRRHAESILAYFTYGITNAIAEGINNVIKVVKRIAFGFHDFEYFRLKVLARTGQLRPFPHVGWH